MTSKLKRKHVDSSSSSSVDSSSASPSIDGTIVRTGTKRRAQRRLEHYLKELKEEMTQMKEEITRMKAEMTLTRMREEMTRARMKKEMARMKKKMTRMKEEMSAEGLQRNDSDVTERINEQKDAFLLQRPSPTSSKEENIRNLKLLCKMKLALRVYTGSKLPGIQIILIDADTNQIVTTGKESSIKVHAVVLDGDFNIEDHENWTREEFDGYIVKERQQRRPLLIGELQVTLKEGAGSLNNLTFTDNSSWNRSKMFRIGVRVASGYCEDTRIREALTDPFSVLEHRGESYVKHYPPQSSDYVWRLECIGKDGRFHKRLNEEGINNVEEFLQAYNKNCQALRNILGNGMTAKKWNSLIDHAKTCPPNGKVFVFYANAERNYGLLFDNFACLACLLQNGVPQPINSVSDSEKQKMDDLVKIAHQNWKDVTEYPLDPVIGRGTIPCPAASVLPGNHDGIPSVLSSQDSPIQNSLLDHLGFSAWPDAVLASLHIGNAGSREASKQASTSQQIVVQAEETTTSHRLVWPTSSSSEPLNLDKPLANSRHDGSFLKL